MNKVVLKNKSLAVGETFFNCIIGKNGLTNEKTEGDLCTPRGVFNVNKILYRKDRVKNINSKIPTIPILKNDAWCDDINKLEYNTQIKLPFDGSYENLYRDDELYDLILVLDYNMNPVVKNKGSAIFIHVAREGMEFTKGCVALNKKDLLELLKMISEKTIFEF